MSLRPSSARASRRTGRLRPAVLLTPLVIAGVALGTAACDASASVSNGVLNVIGSEEADLITIHLKLDDANVLEVDFGSDGTPDFSFDRTTFTELKVSAAGGSDTVLLDRTHGVFTTDIPTTVLGGAGDDILKGENGPEVFDGGPGNDTITAGIGFDSISGGADDDVAIWAPGDNSDTFDGGDGNDRLQFTGSNIGENFTFTKVGGRAHLDRNVAAVTMDLGTVERVDLFALGGIDKV